MFYYDRKTKERSYGNFDMFLLSELLYHMYDTKYI